MKRVGEKRPDIGAEAAGKRIADDRMDVVARRDEGERQAGIADPRRRSSASMRTACTSTSTAIVASTTGGTLNIGS